MGRRNMTAAQNVREITPKPGFVVKGLSNVPGGGKIFINVCSDPVLGAPQDAMGRAVDAAHLDARGIGNLRVPQFAGLSRPVEGLGTVIDVLYDPSVVDRALEGANADYYRDRLAELAVPFVYQETKGMVSMNVQTIKHLKNCRYKGGLGKSGSQPVPIPVEAG